MTSILERFHKEQISRLTENKIIPEFRAGDTICVNVKIVDGNVERIQAFEGICIARKNRGVNSTFTVRKISQHGDIERIFHLYSPRVDNIQVKKIGKVRRAKLYYLRELSGKATRIQEKSLLQRKKIQAKNEMKIKEKKKEQEKAAMKAAKKETENNN